MQGLETHVASAVPKIYTQSGLLWAVWSFVLACVYRPKAIAQPRDRSLQSPYSQKSDLQFWPLHLASHPCSIPHTRERTYLLLDAFRVHHPVSLGPCFHLQASTSDHPSGSPIRGAADNPSGLPCLARSVILLHHPELPHPCSIPHTRER